MFQSSPFDYRSSVSERFGKLVSSVYRYIFALLYDCVIHWGNQDNRNGEHLEMGCFNTLFLQLLVADVISLVLGEILE